MAIRMAQELKLNVEPEFEEASAASGRLSWLERNTGRECVGTSQNRNLEAITWARSTSWLIVRTLY